MLRKIKGWVVGLRLSRRSSFALALAVLVVGAVVWNVVQPAQAARFSHRAMYINSARGGDTTFYTIALQYTTPSVMGSVRLEFCDNPIPSLPCNVPAGLNVSNGELASQIGGETGFDIVEQTSNLIVLGRTPAMTGSSITDYRFDNMRNPNGDHQDFYVRITSHASNDGSGPLIDYGSVTATTTPEIHLITQVPPILVFCVAEQINDDDCTDTQGHFKNFGELNPNNTFTATSEMQARTNAFFGYSIYATGTTFTSGVRSVPALPTPTESFVGVGQFGINLADNSVPDIGAGPTGQGTNAVISPAYSTSNKFLFNDGDVLVTSSGVTRTRKFTASYILNVPANQAPGVYSTTITYVCTGNF